MAGQDLCAYHTALRQLTAPRSVSLQRTVRRQIPLPGFGDPVLETALREVREGSPWLV